MNIIEEIVLKLILNALNNTDTEQKMGEDRLLVQSG